MGDDLGGELGLARDGLLAKAAARRLAVLLLDGRQHLRGRKAEAREPRRIEPDAHGILRAEKLDIAHARHAAQLVDDDIVCVIADLQRRHALVTGLQGDQHQEAGGIIADLDAELLHGLRQPRHDAIEPVLHQRARDIEVGPRLEGEHDLAGAVRRLVEAM